MIGGHLAIRSLPERLRLNSNNLRSDLKFSDVADKDSNFTYSHVIYEIAESERKFGEDILTREHFFYFYNFFNDF